MEHEVKVPSHMMALRLVEVLEFRPSDLNVALMVRNVRPAA